MNGTGNDQLNCAEFVPMRKALLVRRNKVGAESREGHLLSNLIKQALWQDYPESNRSWAKHPTQNLPWMMGVQVEALAKGN